MKNVILDANLVFVLLVGRYNRNILGKRKGTKEYAPEDYDNLVGLLSKYDSIVVTPNVLTECTNLAGENKKGEAALPEHRVLRELITDGNLIREEYIPSKVAVLHSKYKYLGLSDCCILSLVNKETPLMSVDASLVNAALELNPECVNYNWYRRI